MNNRETAEEALARTLKAARDLSGPGEDWNVTANQITAKNILHEELGFYAGHQLVYHLDQDTRDRLLAHARQDAAHAVINTTTLMSATRTLTSEVRWLRRLVLLLIALCLLILVLSLGHNR